MADMFTNEQIQRERSVPRGLGKSPKGLEVSFDTVMNISPRTNRDAAVNPEETQENILYARALNSEVRTLSMTY